MFRHVSASRLRNVFSLNLAFLAYRKNYISGYISPSSSIQTVKCSLLDEKIVYRSFYGAPLTLSSFLLPGKVLFRTRRQVALARCLSSQAFRRLCRKNDISGYIWHRSFIHTVKCSFFNQITVIQSFLGALLKLVQKNRGFACPQSLNKHWVSRVSRETANQTGATRGSCIRRLQSWGRNC